MSGGQHNGNDSNNYSVNRYGVGYITTNKYEVKMDMISTAMNIFGGYYESDRGWRHYRVEGKPYDIQFNARTLEWKCTCPHYIFRKAQCKHIKKIQNNR